MNNPCTGRFFKHDPHKQGQEGADCLMVTTSRRSSHGTPGMEGSHGIRGDSVRIRLGRTARNAPETRASSCRNNTRTPSRIVIFGGRP